MGEIPLEYIDDTLGFLKGFGHYEVYTGEAFRQVIAATLSWYQQYLPV